MRPVCRSPLRFHGPPPRRRSTMKRISFLFECCTRRDARGEEKGSTVIITPYSCRITILLNETIQYRVWDNVNSTVFLLLAREKSYNEFLTHNAEFPYLLYESLTSIRLRRKSFSLDLVTRFFLFFFFLNYWMKFDER